jgi:hypothetical protein
VTIAVARGRDGALAFSTSWEGLGAVLFPHCEHFHPRIVRGQFDYFALFARR